MLRIRPQPVSVAWRTASASLLAEQVRLDKPPGAEQPAAARRRLSGGWPSTIGAPIRAALPEWEKRCCDPRSPCAYVVEQDEDGVWCASVVLRPGVGAAGDRKMAGSRNSGFSLVCGRG